jgi:hypothetical protein
MQYISRYKILNVENNRSKQAKQLIIHFYNIVANKHEFQPILDILESIGARDIRVIAVTINKIENKKLFAFDTGSQKLIPYNGTFVKVGAKEYLLFNNTWYEEASASTDGQHHFPVKISFFSNKAELLHGLALINQLMDQVYQFSRMYWKSTNQQSLPVTIKYPEMVAEIYPYFQHEKLSPFGQESLWFL